jgi:WD40 repeat protein
MRRFRTTRGAPVVGLAYSPAGDRIIALVGNPRPFEAQAWFLPSGKPVQGDGFPRKAEALAVSPHADVIAFGRSEVVDLVSHGGEIRTQVPLPRGSLTMALAVSDDGKTVAMSRGVLAQTVNMQSQIGVQVHGPESRRVEFRSSTLVFDLDLTADGDLLLSSGIGGFTVWDVVRGESMLARSLTGAHSCRFAPDTSTIVVSANEFVTIWDIPTGKPRHSLVGHQAPVRCLALSPDRRVLASGGLDRTVRFWDIASAKPVRTYDWKTGPVHALAFSPDGLTCAAGGESGEVVIWDVED